VNYKGVTKTKVKDSERAVTKLKVNCNPTYKKQEKEPTAIGRVTQRSRERESKQTPIAANQLEEREG